MNELVAQKFAQIDHSRPAAEQISIQLRDSILRLKLSPGCKISESQVGEQFGVSRTPVREALADLRNAGLVETLPNRGNFVTKLSEHRLREAQYIREGLELSNIRFVCERGLKDSDREKLDAVMETQSRALDECNSEQFQATDDLFHDTIALATGFPRARTLLAREKMVLDRLRVFSLRDEAHIRELYREHAALFDAIRCADMPAAEAIAKNHLSRVLRNLSELVATNSEYFENE